MLAQSRGWIVTHKKLCLALGAACLLTGTALSHLVAAAEIANDATLKTLEAKMETQAKPTNEDFERLGEIINRNPQSARAHIILGLCYEKLGLASQAVQQYDTASKLAPNDPKPLADLVLARIHSGDVGDISGLIAHALNRFPNDPEVLFLAGYDALQNRKLIQSEKYLSQAYKAKPDIPWLKCVYAELLLYRHNPVKAYVLAKAELKTDPKNWRANMVAGLALIDGGHYTDSLKYLRIASDARPDRTDISEKLAVLSAWSGDYAEAIRPNLRCLAICTGATSHSPRLENLLLDCFKRTPKAVAVRVVEEESSQSVRAAQNAYYQNAVGEALQRVGWDDAAIAQYRAAVKLKPNFGLATYNLAHENEYYLHDYQQAKILYRLAQQLGLPDNLSATDSINRLEDRLLVRKQDLAWRLKDLLIRPSQ